jgi:hypothetical protein
MTGDKQVPALFKDFGGASDQMSITKVTTVKEGYMLITDFENCMDRMTVKVFPSESSARSFSPNERILKVKVEREL